jgi:hypothetical protein
MSRNAKVRTNRGKEHTRGKGIAASALVDLNN